MRVDNERGADSYDFLSDVYYCVSVGAVSDVPGQLSVFHDWTDHKPIQTVVECWFQRSFLRRHGMAGLRWTKQET